MQITQRRVSTSTTATSDFASWATNTFKETTEAMFGSIEVFANGKDDVDDTLEEIGYGIGVDGILICDEDRSGSLATRTRPSGKTNKKRD
mmetsp:Transcript_4600/g.6059  ORF Transcript_4600/g.6059 Transcript_4600/m.6059 type:complete len:90 (+) Transcript_4600:60-329(+)|eukprot:CAMPEP_0195284506 /NCGR_PEP_ID=MMETSP0707-20130614/2686_1 /TAXON_ID=33640 /ORGANISM="Asterionellopsis glacialis, Strain CCMP134" /LENGTH=89 /DNA_ID=CAMNT_0040343859 /DNA_START=100 /DNA_END=369 /DNA_ORIENTATION=+